MRDPTPARAASFRIRYVRDNGQQCADRGRASDLQSGTDSGRSVDPTLGDQRPRGFDQHLEITLDPLATRRQTHAAAPLPQPVAQYSQRKRPLERRDRCVLRIRHARLDPGLAVPAAVRLVSFVDRFGQPCGHR